jgi:hypothetical protein
MSPARAARALLWLGCLAVQLAAIRNMWLEVRVTNGQVLRARFEDPRGRPELALTECCGEEFFPGPGIDAQGAVAVSPGLIAVPILERGATFIVTTDESTAAPYLVFGTRHAAADVDWLADPRRLDPGDQGLRLVAWDGGRAWRADARWLAALSERCGGSETRSVRVVTTSDHAEVRVGSCPPATVPISGAEPLLMAVLAGPSWVKITREPTGYRVERNVNTGVLGPLLVLAAISVAGLAVVGTAALVTVSAALLVASVVVPIAAWLAFLGVAILVVIVAVFRLSARVAPFRRRWMQLCIGAMSVAIVLLTSVAGLQRAMRGGFWERHWTASNDAGPRCQLVGYSPVADAQLRDGGGVSSMLAQCSACSGGLDVDARHGGRLDWTRRQVCAPEPSSATQAIVAIGGNNDDMLWARGLGSIVRHARATVRFVSAVYARNVRPDYLLPTLDAFAESASGAADEQEASLRAAVQCAHDRGARFVFFHDLFIEDLTAGRSPTRRALLERRRDAVGPDGRERFFVDALEAFPEMGVSWFNDMRHPSLIGHRKITERICDILQHPSGGAASASGAPADRPSRPSAGAAGPSATAHDVLPPRAVSA